MIKKVRKFKREKDTKKQKELKHKSRRLSIKEGIFASGKLSFGDNYISPFAIAANATNSQIAMLSSISGILGPISQMFSSRLMEKHSRKKIVTKMVFIESLMWIPFILLALALFYGFKSTSIPVLILISFGIYVITLNIAHPAWFSWMGDIVDETYRGRWFSKRNRIIGFVTIILTLFAAFFLDFMVNKGLTMIGFSLLFVLAMYSRLKSWKIFHNQYEPELKLKEGYYFSYYHFLINSKNNNLGRFTIFRSVYSIAMFISSPLITVYLLRNLQLSYLIYTIIILSILLFSTLSLGVWGKFADRYGNYRILLITSILLSFYPISWMMNTSTLYLILIPPIIGGIASGGFNLASGSFIYDNSTSEKRGLVISYVNVTNGIGIAIGSLIGAFLIKYLSVSIPTIFAIFILSSLFMILVTFAWIPEIKEARKTESFNGRQAFNNLILKGVKPTIIEEVHDFIAIKQYLREK
jgi:MFS family permease